MITIYVDIRFEWDPIESKQSNIYSSRIFTFK